MPQPYDDAVYRLAGAIPPGCVLTYGDIAELLGSGGPRQVGAAMSQSTGRNVPWWRVVRADGTLPDGLIERAKEHWTEEEIPMHRGRIRLAAARWQPDDAGFAFLDAVAADLAGTAPATSNCQGHML
ncbi:MGMT family protein [Arthrobacter sp. JSM 101049]|uniref:MGMT family protein n=1 Tax=Arthrobacter sp. JSM 101049 TaxID=929097 RepID=UPI003564CEB1